MQYKEIHFNDKNKLLVDKINIILIKYYIYSIGNIKQDEKSDK